MSESFWPPTPAPQSVKDYWSGRWCGECTWGKVENPPCCWQPDAAESSERE